MTFRYADAARPPSFPDKGLTQSVDKIEAGKNYKARLNLHSDRVNGLKVNAVVGSPRPARAGG